MDFNIPVASVRCDMNIPVLSQITVNVMAILPTFTREGDTKFQLKVNENINVCFPHSKVLEPLKSIHAQPGPLGKGFLLWRITQNFTLCHEPVPRNSANP